MTDEMIQSFLDQLNTGKGEALIFIRALTDTVDEARVFDEIPKPTDRIKGSPMRAFLIFFIKANNGEYVGAVVDMSQENLHWYMDPKYRKQGHLTQALKYIILPYLLENRDNQHITIENDDLGLSESVAINVGFKKIENDQYGRAQYQFDSDLFENLPELKEWVISMSENRINEIKHELHFYARKLAILYHEAQMGLGENHHSWSFFEKFNNVIATIEGLGYRMESIQKDMVEERD